MCVSYQTISAVAVRWLFFIITFWAKARLFSLFCFLEFFSYSKAANLFELSICSWLSLKRCFQPNQIPYELKKGVKRSKLAGFFWACVQLSTRKNLHMSFWLKVELNLFEFEQYIPMWLKDLLFSTPIHTPLHLLTTNLLTCTTASYL